MGKDEDYATAGPLTTIFGSTTARILDQCLIVGNMEQTISMLAESTNLSYKTAFSGVDRLVNLGLMRKTRKIGNAQAYQFLVNNELHELISCAQSLQFERLTKK